MDSLFPFLFLSFGISLVYFQLLFFLRTSEINLFYNLQVFYWHFLEILWLFIFLVLYLWFHCLNLISQLQELLTKQLLYGMSGGNLSLIMNRLSNDKIIDSTSEIQQLLIKSTMNIAKDRKVIPDPIDDRKFQE